MPPTGSGGGPCISWASAGPLPVSPALTALPAQGMAVVCAAPGRLNPGPRSSLAKIPVPKGDMEAERPVASRTTMCAQIVNISVGFSVDQSACPQRSGH